MSASGPAGDPCRSLSIGSGGGMRKGFFFTLGLSSGLAYVAACSGGNHGTSSGDMPDASSTTDAPSGPDSAGGSSDGSGNKPKVASGTSHGSTIALSDDDSRLVVANPDVGTATIFSIDYSGTFPALTKMAEIAVGAEPSAVLIHPNADSAYVLSRKDQTLTKITGLLSTPTMAGSVAVGSEPTGMAMTPLGNTVYVANWVDGTVVGVKTDTMLVSTTIDLNATLAAAPYLGPNLTSRPALAHPRAVAITNNGDMVEDDETMLVAEYFSQQKTPLMSDVSNAATNWIGVVYKIPLKTHVPSIIEIP